MSNKSQARTVQLFLFIPISLIILYVIIPFLLMVFYSFTNWDGYSPTYDFVGFKNYSKLWTQENISPLLVSSYYLFASVLQLLIGVLLALYVYFKKRYKKLFVTILVLPILINTVAVGLIFRLFLMPGSSFDMLLDSLHIITYANPEESIKWIGNTRIVNYTLAIISIWRYTPYTFILIYGAFETIDKRLIDAARQQGASNFQIATKVLLPNIKTTLMIVVITLIIGALSAVELPMIMTGGMLGTQTIVMRIQEIGFNMRDFGLASVLSLFVSAIILLIILCKQIKWRDDVN